MVIRGALPFVLLVVSAELCPAQVQTPAHGLPVIQKPAGAAVPAVQFVCIARERGPKPQKDWSDMQVTLWDVAVAKPAVRRIVFGRSHWNAAPLFDAPTLLRWQVPSTAAGRRRGYEVRLLQIDFERFAAKELLHTQQVHGIGTSGDRVYLQTTDGQMMLDLAHGSSQEIDPPFRLLAEHGDDWLVEVAGSVARFDAAKGKVTRRYQKIAAKPAGARHDRTRWNGGRFAVRDGDFVDDAGALVEALDFGVVSIVCRELRVWDLETGTESKVRVRMQARGGSGEPILATSMPIELVGGLLRYTERRPAVGKHADLDGFDWERDAEWVTIDIATGKELLRVPYRKRDLPQVDLMQEHRIPDYLRDGFAESPIRAWGPEQDLAFAFFEHKGIDAKLPATGVRKFDAVCRSEDGAQLLVLLRDTLYLCDLGERSVQKWAAPAAWRNAIVDLHAVAMR